MSKQNQSHVVVIGAGIVGVSTAIWLCRSGAKVTLVDRVLPGSDKSTSFGNAGLLAACSVAPVTAPGMISKSPKMLLDPNFPLFLRWSYFPKLIPWLLQYLSHANDRDTRRIARGLAEITYDSVDQHKDLTKGTEAAEWMVSSDYGFAYSSRAAFEADHYTWMLRQEAGFEPDIVENSAVQELEPNLTPDVKCLAIMPNHGYVLSPGRYVAALFQEAQKLGAKWVQADVKDFAFEDGCVSGVLTATDTIKCSQVVVTTGVWSGSLTKKLGLKVPLESERGYHIQFEGSEGGPSIPLMITSGKFVATPMKDGLRCAGVVEFGGLDAPASSKPLNLLRKKVKQNFPKLTFAREHTWLGHRPATSDSLPLIGEIGETGVFTGFGHQHIGLTSGPKTGRILAGLISGQNQNADLKAYNPMRF